MSELINRAKRYIDLWDRTSCVEIDILTGMVDAREAYYAAPEVVRELVAEVEQLQAGGPWVEHVERQRAMKRERDGECICDCNPETTNGPEEFCPWHGRTYNELVDIIVRQQSEINGGGDIGNEGGSDQKL